MSANEELAERIERLRSQGRNVATLKMSKAHWVSLLQDPDVEFGEDRDGPPFGLFYDGIPVRFVDGMSGVEIDLGPERENPAE